MNVVRAVAVDLGSESVLLAFSGICGGSVRWGWWGWNLLAPQIYPGKKLFKNLSSFKSKVCTDHFLQV
jgi:hypothetical protein